MRPWFIATDTFSARDGEAWEKYISWSGLTQLDEVVSLDSMLCPSVLPDIKDHYWSHIVNEDFMLRFFVDLEFLLAEIADVPRRNLLCAYRNPLEPPSPPQAPVVFEFMGYDVVDTYGEVSALTNCGGFPDVFSNSELSRNGLLTSFSRAREVQLELQRRYPDEPHANCHMWAIFRSPS